MENLKLRLQSIFSRQMIVLILVLAIPWIHYMGDFWWPRWMAFEIAGLALMGYILATRYGWLAGLALFLPITAAIAIFGPLVPGPGSSLAIDDITLSASIGFILLAIPVALASQELQEAMETGLGLLCLLVSVFVMVEFAKGINADNRGGIFGNSSMNGCFIALSYPFVAFRGTSLRYKAVSLFKINAQDAWAFLSDLLLVFVPIIAIFLEGASIPVGAMALVYIGYLFCNRNEVDGLNSMPRKMVTAGVLLFVFLASAAYFIPNLFFTSGRFAFWKVLFDWWLRDGERTFGSGSGTFFLIGPHLQNTMHFDPNKLWIWAHNDWFQLLIENGIAGALVYLALFIQILVKTWRSGQAYLFAAAIGYGAVAMFNFPSHNALTAFLGILIAVRSLDKTLAPDLTFK